ncbi:MAG: hypothetical protein JNJ73_19560 [Hyphomonadaceae bacterium]|nr:hypothetical protein [Hyphomonadaceae bacterium]
MLHKILPAQVPLTYAPVGRCIYCGAAEALSDEHIIPYGLGGRLVLPASSCAACAKITGAFEGTCLRTCFGPLRMLYDLPSRRKRERPDTLPLKVKRTADEDWTDMQVAREDYPFLVLFPHLSGPTLLSGRTDAEQGAKANRFWIRGASESAGFKPHLNELCQQLGVHSVMPTAEFRVEEFCLMLAKIAHAYAVAECGPELVEPTLLSMIRTRDFSERSRLMGSIRLMGRDDPRARLHDISVLDTKEGWLSVGVQLLAPMDTPTYLVHAGRRRE